MKILILFEDMSYYPRKNISQVLNNYCSILVPIEASNFEYERLESRQFRCPQSYGWKWCISMITLRI